MPAHASSGGCREKHAWHLHAEQFKRSHERAAWLAHVQVYRAPACAQGAVDIALLVVDEDAFVGLNAQLLLARQVGPRVGLQHLGVASLNPDLPLRSQCLFGSGTAIALTHGEYRPAFDIDLIVSSKDGYREVCGLVNAQGIETLMVRALPLRREARIAQ